MTEINWVLILAVLLFFAVIRFFEKPIVDFILKHAAHKILALAFLIVIGITIFIEGLGKEVRKTQIYVPMGFAMAIQVLQMRHRHHIGKVTKKNPNSVKAQSP
ncbi:MAG: hypothetical protein CMI27_01810 [Opitutae bacterium]|nr:hypothetical protein [Opitutae bacterium]